MPRELLTSAIEQARDGDPVVRTLVLLGAARVLSPLDREEAARIFAEGVRSAERVPLTEHNRAFVFDAAVRLGVTADTASAIDLLRRQRGDPHPARRGTGSFLVQALVKSGDLERAVALLEDLTCDAGGAGAVLRAAGDPVLKRRAMFAARERWRARGGSATRHAERVEREFYSVVAWGWQVLGAEEASRWLDEILLAIETDPNEPHHHQFNQGVELHWSRDVHLFEVLNVVRALRPEHDVNAILARHPDVAIAAQTFPLGLESVVTRPPQAPAGDERQEDRFCYVSTGSPGETDLIPTLMAAHRRERSAIPRLLDGAHRLFREDTDPLEGNLAPLVFWPSCVAYKRALYWAGRIIGAEAKPLVSEVPSRDMELLASVELAAGLLGLDECPGAWMTRRARRS